MPVRAYLVDDDELVRTGFRLILSAAPDIEVVGEAGDAETGLAEVVALRPDVVLMDLRLPGVDGVQATRQVLARSETVRVVVVTSYGTDEQVFGALSAGASGFLFKDATAAQLCDAVRLAARGDALLAPSVTRRLLEQFAGRGEATLPRTDRLAGLTVREREVLAALAEGLSNSEVAERLVLSEATVKTHVTSMLRKLGLRDRTQLVVQAYRSGLVQP